MLFYDIVVLRFDMLILSNLAIFNHVFWNYCLNLIISLIWNVLYSWRMNHLMNYQLNEPDYFHGRYFCHFFR